jgi:putative phage-type endonuclease
MQREIVPFTDKQSWLQARSQDVTSTEVAALFGLSPYTTEFELFHKKKSGEIEVLAENDRMKWGTRLQDSIALGIAQDNGFQVDRFDGYMRVPEARIGSSFDFFMEPSGILEIKNVDALIFRDGWIVEDGELTAPHHIELQLQHQLLVKGASIGYIGALVGGNRVSLLQRFPDQEIHTRILEEAERFWKQVDAGIAPTPDFVKDAEFIAKLYKQAEPGKIVTADMEIDQLARQYKEAAALEKQAKEQKDALKAEMLMRIGDASKVVGEGFSITASTTAESFVEAYTRAGFRQFRINWKKEK